MEWTGLLDGRRFVVVGDGVMCGGVVIVGRYGVCGCNSFVLGI